MQLYGIFCTLVNFLNLITSQLFIIDEATFDIWLDSCVAKWNISTYDYDVTMSWTVNGSLADILEFKFQWFEYDLDNRLQENSRPDEEIIQKPIVS